MVRLDGARLTGKSAELARTRPYAPSGPVRGLWPGCQRLSEQLISVVNAGANLEQFLLLAVNHINDVPNATRAIAMIPSGPDDNFEFRRGVQLLSALEQRGAIEVTFRLMDDTEIVSDPI